MRGWPAWSANYCSTRFFEPDAIVPSFAWPCRNARLELGDPYHCIGPETARLLVRENGQSNGWWPSSRALAGPKWLGPQPMKCWSLPGLGKRNNIAIFLRRDFPAIAWKPCEELAIRARSKF